MLGVINSKFFTNDTFLGLVSSGYVVIIYMESRRWTGSSRTRSGPEGSSRNEILSGSSSGFPLNIFIFVNEAHNLRYNHE